MTSGTWGPLPSHCPRATPVVMGEEACAGVRTWCQPHHEPATRRHMRGDAVLGLAANRGSKLALHFEAVCLWRASSASLGSWSPPPPRRCSTPDPTGKYSVKGRRADISTSHVLSTPSPCFCASPPPSSGQRGGHGTQAWPIRAFLGLVYLQGRGTVHLLRGQGSGSGVGAKALLQPPDPCLAKCGGGRGSMPQGRRKGGSPGREARA